MIIPHNLCVISIAILVSSAACKPSMRITKSYLRSTMTDEQLSNLSVLYIKKGSTKALNLDIY